jgi:hypothetical protein
MYFKCIIILWLAASPALAAGFLPQLVLQPVLTTPDELLQNASNPTMDISAHKSFMVRGCLLAVWEAQESI